MWTEGIVTAKMHDVLDRAIAGRPLGVADVVAVLECEELEPVLSLAREVRDEGLARRGLCGIVTYSRKVFIPLTHLCRYRCSYCTFVTPRVEPGVEFLTTEQVLDIARRGREWGCTEALFTLGEAPEHRHPEAHQWLAANGFETTVDYLIHCAGLVLIQTGLLPHVNPGAISAQEMLELRRVAPSQGLMMEQLTDRLLEPGQAHAGAAGKAKAERLGQLRQAAETNTPFTTGLLIGIGESLRERAETITAIRDAGEGQIQEVIVQNFRAKADTPMRGFAEPTEGDMLRTLAAARLAFGPEMSIQAPPNLTPKTYGRYLDAGINDWGGVSPVTPDHVNPEMPWPALKELSQVCESKGFALRQRLPVYPQYIVDRWMAPEVRRHVLAVADSMGLAREERWYAGEGWRTELHQAQKVTKRRALAIAANTPVLTADEVSHRAISGNGHGTSTHPNQGSKIALDHERADLGSGSPNRWIAPYLRTNSPKLALEDGRPSLQQVERMLRSEGADLSSVIQAADELRSEICGDEVSYVINRNITYTNFCHTGCGFCGFARPVGHEDGYYFDPQTVGAKAKEAWDLGATEVCVQGGIHPGNDGNIYLDITKSIKEAAPQIHLHGFSPLEVTVGASTLGLPISEFIPMLAEAGLDSMPGTAAEILDDKIRPQITPEKLTADAWLEVMRTAHRCGIKSTSTIMFGHLDDPASWAGHLLALRDLQEETGGFTELVPLPFVHHKSPIFMRGASRTGPTWREVIKMHAVARLVLHPLITNIQASWVKLGVSGVVACLEVGVNDFGGTLMEEHISRMAGASHGLGLKPEEIVEAIRKAGRTPRQRNTIYGSPILTSNA